MNIYSSESCWHSILWLNLYIRRVMMSSYRGTGFAVQGPRICYSSIVNFTVDLSSDNQWPLLPRSQEPIWNAWKLVSQCAWDSKRRHVIVYAQPYRMYEKNVYSLPTRAKLRSVADELEKWFVPVYSGWVA